MVNTEWFSIRTLTLPATAIALLAAFFIVWLVLRMQFSKKWSGVYADAIFTFIIVWKFSLIITDFNAVLAQPFALVYFNGGTLGVYFGAITVLLQLLWKRQKLQFDAQGVSASVWAIILTQSIYQWFVVLLNDNSINSEVITLIVLSILTLFILWKITAPIRAIIIYTVGYLIVATLQPQGLWQPAVGVSVLLLMLGLGIQRVGGKK
ncbi:hypothetical protein ACQKII_01905 [Lysinibacillus sp. NPDC048646]|uniref:hypothetical protein n=1 Tax=Lysinibacillus sp. NPDC048646 TaxID=3390574 RepID=UPI003D04BE2D